MTRHVPRIWYERTRALQQLAREIDEDFVREALLNKPLDQVRVYLTERHPDCRFLAIRETVLGIRSDASKPREAGEAYRGHQ
jgi:hypothetical protein